MLRACLSSRKARAGRWRTWAGASSLDLRHASNTRAGVAMPSKDGMTTNNNLSYLQTPTYQIVTVFVIFIFVSLTIEKMLMRVRHRIEGSGTKGLMHAFQAVLNELVLLGFLSFMLEIFGPVRASNAPSSPCHCIPEFSHANYCCALQKTNTHSLRLLRVCALSPVHLHITDAIHTTRAHVPRFTLSRKSRKFASTCTRLGQHHTGLPDVQSITWATRRAS